MSKGKEITAGLLFIAGIVLLGIFTIVVKDIPVLRDTYTLDIIFQDVQGLQEGADVTYLGKKIGKVTSMLVERASVRVSLRLDEAIAIRQGYCIEIRRASMLGGHIIAIDPGPISNPPADVTALRGKAMEDPFRSISNLVTENSDNIQRMTESLSAISSKIETGEGSLHNLIYDSKLYDDLAEITSNVKTITADLLQGKGTAGKLLQDDAAYETFRMTSANLAEITTKIKNAEGTIGKLVNDDAMYQDLRSLLAKMNAGEGTIGKLITDDSLYRDIQESARNVRDITSKINEGRGTVGKLINDDDLYTAAREALTEAGNAIEDFREQAPISAFTSTLFRVFQ